MTIEVNGKSVHIPDAEIANSMTKLDLSKDEAIQMWLEDNNLAVNEEVERLTEKAKVNKINHEAKSDKPRKSVKKERKPDEEKENLIKILADCLKNAGFDAEIVNKSKIIEFNCGENHYKLDLIKQRTPKK